MQSAWRTKAAGGRHQACSLLPGAVEELLRYTSPVNHATFRFTAEPVKIGGTLIPAREPVLVAIASANRDPDRYPAPDQVDFGRAVGGNLAFGHGIHTVARQAAAE